jgi:hypothetical protein
VSDTTKLKSSSLKMQKKNRKITFGRTLLKNFEKKTKWASRKIDFATTKILSSTSPSSIKYPKEEDAAQYI